MTGTSQFILYPSVPPAPGQGTDTMSHIAAITNRQEARLPQRSTYSGLPGKEDSTSEKSHSSFRECY